VVGRCWGWLWIMGITIDQLNTDLLGESELNLLAGWSVQASNTFLNSFNRIHDFWNSDAPGFNQILTADTGQKDWLVNTGLDWLWVGNSDWNINWGDNWDIVESLLSHLVAILVSVTTISMMSIATSRLANSHHLNILFLLEGHLNSLGIGAFFLLLVAVAADLIGDLLNAFSAHGTGHIITKFSVNNDLNGQVNI